MTVQPALRSMLDAMAAAPPADPTLGIEQRRKTMDELTVAGFASVGESGPAMFEEFTHRVPVNDGVIRVRTYRPEPGGELACYVYIHGGGWWLGNIDIYDESCRAMAAHLGCVVASIGYRLAPEHSFPTAAEDCYAGLRWVAMNADVLGIADSRIAVGGSSAGGNGPVSAETPFPWCSSIPVVSMMKNGFPPACRAIRWAYASSSPSPASRASCVESSSESVSM